MVSPVCDMRMIWLPDCSVIHTYGSMRAIETGIAVDDGSGYSVIIPVRVERPTACPAPSANQRSALGKGPTAMPTGRGASTRG